VAEFFAKFGVEQWLALMSALLAVSSFVLNLRLVGRQEKRNATNLKLAHDSDIIGWSDDVIAALANAQEMLAEKGVSYGEAEFPARRSAARANLSALIDRGRLFFPNRADDTHGADKEVGYQGHRQPVLEVLVQAYATVDRAGGTSGPDRAAGDALLKQRRLFVAEVFKTVDPIRRGETIKELAA
jgi:hypothetical protein